MSKHLTILTPCYNELDNVEPLCTSILNVMNQFPEYTFNHLFIDNASTDGTQEKLRILAEKYSHVQVIFNARNFGHIRSPFYGLLQARGDAVITMASDFQDPPELIADFIEKWKDSNKIVVGIKLKSKESIIFFTIRKLYYSLVNKLSETELIKNFTGFGLYDREVINTLRQIDDSYPYFRGLIADLGYKTAKVEFEQPTRKRGLTKNNLYTLYDMAMLGITNHSKIPLRLATLLGFLVSILSLMTGILYIIYKLMFFDRFEAGIAPLVVGLFFFGAVQLFFIGVIGEYIGSIHTQVLKRPLVIERERINIDSNILD